MLQKEGAGKVRVLSVKQYPIDLTSKQSTRELLLRLKTDVDHKALVGISFEVTSKQTVLTELEESLSKTDMQNFVQQRIAKQAGGQIRNWLVKVNTLEPANKQKIKVYGIGLSSQQCMFARLVNSQLKLKRVESYFCTLMWLSWWQLCLTPSFNVTRWALLFVNGGCWEIAVFDQSDLVYHKTLSENERMTNEAEISAQVCQLLTLLNITKQIPLLVLPIIFKKLTPFWQDDNKSKALLCQIKLPASVVCNEQDFITAEETLSIALALKVMEKDKP